MVIVHTRVTFSPFLVTIMWYKFREWFNLNKTITRLYENIHKSNVHCLLQWNDFFCDSISYFVMFFLLQVYCHLMIAVEKQKLSYRITVSFNKQNWFFFRLKFNQNSNKRDAWNWVQKTHLKDIKINDILLAVCERENVESRLIRLTY